MLTLFAIPKPFHGHINTIQRNAIRSWTFLQPRCEVILFGKEAGVAETAKEFNLRHVADVECNEFGTPLLNNVFDQASQLASHKLICYVNSDIMLLQDFVEAVQRIEVKKSVFLMVGQRWNINLDYPWDFSKGEWEKQMSAYVEEYAKLHPQSGSDYFVFPKNTKLTQLPPFAVGRPGWDNWFLFRARQLRIPVIDATQATTVIHQNHDYHHVPQQHGNRWEGPEADRNRALMENDRLHRFTLLDATHLLTDKGLHLALQLKYLRRRWQRMPILHPAVKPLVQLSTRVRRWVLSFWLTAKKLRPA